MKLLEIITISLLSMPAWGLDATTLQNEVSDFMRQHIDEQLASSGSSPRIELEVGPIDSSTVLGDCQEALSFEPRGSRELWGRQQVKVSCASPQPWSVFVPVLVKAYREVVVARGPIPRGALISEGDIEMAEKELNALGRNFFDDPADVVGKAARRNIPAGGTFGPGAVEAMDVVKRGDDVRISAGAPGMVVSMQGKALSDGHVGQRIRVENLSSKRIVQAVVTGAGEVSVSQ